MWLCFRFSFSARRGSERDCDSERPPELGVESIVSGQARPPGRKGRPARARSGEASSIGASAGEWPGASVDADRRWEWNVVRMKKRFDGLENWPARL